MKYFVFILTLTLSLSASQAAEPGTTGANFLKMGIGPRAIAMGEAQAGLADDVYAAYWNPAGLAQLEAQQAGFVYTQYVEDITEQFAVYAYPHRAWGTLAASLTRLSVGRFQGYDAAGQPTQNVEAGDTAIALSYARPLLRDRRMEQLLSVGLTGKLIQEDLDGVTARAAAVDGGLFFTPGRLWGGILRGWRAGLAVRNAGTSLRFDQESCPLPRTLVGGLSYTGSWRDELITAAIDGEMPRDGDPVFHAGLEVWTLRTLVLRGGYTSQGNLGNGLRAGAGIRFKVIQLDYAFTGLGVFGDVHRAGLTLTFGARPRNQEAVAQDWHEKGLKQFRRQRYTQAMVSFNKSLELDPSHPEALQMMRKTYEQIRGPAVEE